MGKVLRNLICTGMVLVGVAMVLLLIFMPMILYRSRIEAVIEHTNFGEDFYSDNDYDPEIDAFEAHGKAWDYFTEGTPGEEADAEYADAKEALDAGDDPTMTDSAIETYRNQKMNSKIFAAPMSLADANAVVVTSGLLTEGALCAMNKNKEKGPESNTENESQNIDGSGTASNQGPAGVNENVTGQRQAGGNGAANQGADGNDTANQGANDQGADDTAAVNQRLAQKDAMEKLRQEIKASEDMHLHFAKYQVDSKYDQLSSAEHITNDPKYAFELQKLYDSRDKTNMTERLRNNHYANNAAKAGSAGKPAQNRHPRNQPRRGRRLFPNSRRLATLERILNNNF